MTPKLLRLTQKVPSITRRGFSLIEVILASSLFSLLVMTLIGALLYGQESTALSANRARAVLLAEEGQEAVRNIRDQSFLNLSNGAYGLSITGNQWSFSGTQDITDGFTRQVVISTTDASTKKVDTIVTWQQNQQRLGSTTLTSYLSNWRTPLTPGRNGILVYGNGGTTADTIQYKIFDGTAGQWSAAQSTADVDPATSNRALRVAEVYASATRNEKVVLSRHYNGTTQSIYGQVFNGATWGNVIVLSSWNATTFLDVANFSGTYLANGDFMTVYSDNTTTPKFRVWNGTTWSGQASLLDIGGIPNYIIAKARPGTSEVMAAIFGQRKDTNTAYFNGGTYITTNWTLHAQHASAAPTNTKRFVDFAWSPNNAFIGGLIYADAGNDRSLTIKTWTADGSGGGSWSAAANTINQTNVLGAMAIIGKTGADEFIACDKDGAAQPRIICYKSTFTPVWSNPVNQLIVSGTDPGIQKSYDIGFETTSGQLAINVYSDASVTPKFKKYSAATSTWDAAASTINNLTSSMETVRLVPQFDRDDIMIIMADTTQRLYSVEWDGTNNLLYTTPAGRAFSTHGTNGSADESYWYDFAWDRP